MNRDELKARLGKVVAGHTRAIGEGFEPGLEIMRGQLADIAGQHALDTGTIAVRRDDDLPPDGWQPTGDQIATWMDSPAGVAWARRQARIQGTAPSRARAPRPKAGQA